LNTEIRAQDPHGPDQVLEAARLVSTIGIDYER